jgi:hypothetical protein
VVEVTPERILELWTREGILFKWWLDPYDGFFHLEMRKSNGRLSMSLQRVIPRRAVAANDMSFDIVVREMTKELRKAVAE